MYCRVLNWISTNVSEVRAACIIRTIAQKILSFILPAVRTWNLTGPICYGSLEQYTHNLQFLKTEIFWQRLFVQVRLVILSLKMKIRHYYWVHKCIYVNNVICYLRCFEPFLYFKLIDLTRRHAGNCLFPDKSQYKQMNVVLRNTNNM
jgi:hypothetical protein